MKPVALVERAIRNSSKRQDIVLDPMRLGRGEVPAHHRKAGVAFGMRHVKLGRSRSQTRWRGSRAELPPCSVP